MQRPQLILLLLILAPARARAASPSADDPVPLPGDALPGLDAAQQRQFEAGRRAFELSLFEPDGLGPVFNDDSCLLCHNEPAVGGSSSRTVVRFGAAGPPFDPLVALGGPVRQALAINPAVEELVPPEADTVVLRLTPHVFGAGLVERIADAELLAREVNPPSPFVSGRVHWVQPLEGGAPRAGRFGWKSQTATLLSFSAEASLDELGQTNRLLPEENAPGGDVQKLRLYDTVPDPEDGPDVHGWHRIDRLTHFQALLAPPPQTPAAGMRGEQVFRAVGCADCHVPRFTTAPAAEAVFDRVELRPYSDFLLHDMGVLGDGVVQGQARPREMRTAPLWGLAYRRFQLHDGSATAATAAEATDVAIRAHDGEGAHALTAYAALDDAQRGLLLDFLMTLGRAPFDLDGDGDVDGLDWAGLEPALSGPFEAGPPTVLVPDDPASVADADADGDLDLVDFGALQRAWSGSSP